MRQRARSTRSTMSPHRSILAANGAAQGLQKRVRANNPSRPSVLPCAIRLFLMYLQERWKGCQSIAFATLRVKHCIGPTCFCAPMGSPLNSRQARRICRFRPFLPDHAAPERMWCISAAVQSASPCPVCSRSLSRSGACCSLSRLRSALSACAGATKLRSLSRRNDPITGIRSSQVNDWYCWAGFGASRTTPAPVVRFEAQAGRNFRTHDQALPLTSCAPLLS